MTKYYKICQLPSEAFRYRGIQRSCPYPPDYENDDPLLYSACIKYIENNERFESRDDAIHFWNLLGGTNAEFEVISIDSTPLKPVEGLLGFDVVEDAGWNSMLSWDWFKNPPSWYDGMPNLVLMRLVFEYFRETTNAHHLFKSHEHAEQFRSVIGSLNALADTFEHSASGEYTILAISTV